MQVAIETCIDVATHMAAGLDLPRKEKASDIFLLLGEHDVVSQETAQRLAKAAGLRNIIVHEYTKIDYQLAYADLDEKLQDLKSFGKEVLDFLDRMGE